MADDAFRHGEFASGLYPRWPWSLDDLRPQGFLGRAYELRPAVDDWRPPLPLPHEAADWRVAAGLASRFWQSVLDSPAISADFKQIAGAASRRVGEAVAQVR